MKKLILTVALLYAPVFLFSQGFGIGIKAGANFSNMSADDVSTSSITSYHGGAYANINFSEKWGITPELLWSAQGAEIEKKKFKTSFVTVPILLRWRVIKPLSLELGPQFNFLTNAKYDGDDIKDQCENTTYSMAFGAVVHLPLKFNAGLRYVAGMSELADSDDWGEVKDQTFQLYLGWTIIGAH